MSDISSNLPVVDKADGSVGSSAPTTATYIAGLASTGNPSFSNGNIEPISLNLSGGLRVDASGYQSPIVGTGSNGSPNGGVLSIQGVSGGSNVPVSVSSTVPALDNSGTGTISILNGTIAASTNGCTTVQFNTSGTWNATLTIEGLINTTWISIVGDIDLLDIVGSSFTTNTLVTVPCGGFSQVRIRASSYTSGTATVDWSSGVGSNVVEVFNAVGNSLKTTIIQPPNDISGSGTIVALNTTVVASTQGCSSVTFDVTGTWVATLVTEGTVGDGNWFIINGDVDVNDSISSSFTTNTFVTIPCGSFSQVRIRTSLYTSGTVSISWNASVGSNTIEVFNTNASSFLSTTRLNDGVGNSIASINSQLQTRDVINVSSQYRAQSVTTSAAEAIGAASRLTNRKFISITPTNGTIYWGTNSSVTTTTGSPLFPNNTLFLSFTDNVPVYVIAGATVDVRILEGS